MFKRTVLAFLIGITAVTADAQQYNIHQGEFGAAIGLGHYFGDLNTKASVRRPKFSAGIFFIKQFNNYVGLKIAGDYAFLGYSDVFSKNDVEKRRNLSFNSNVWEASLSGYFNFFKFMPGVEGYNYTPYVSLGIGVFSFDPFAYLQGQKYYLLIIVPNVKVSDTRDDAISITARTKIFHKISTKLICLVVLR